jgi:DNA polymerase sigma
LCRVVVVNTAPARLQHDQSPQHMHNQQQRQQQLRMQQQQQQLSHPSQESPLAFAQHAQLASASAAPSSISPPGVAAAASAAAASAAAASASPPLDLNALQTQLRSFMRAQEEAKARGLPPITMDPLLMRAVHDMQQRMAQQQQHLQQHGAGGATAAGGEEKEKGKHDLASLAVIACTGSPSGHVYPSRAALIAACSEAPVIPTRRLALKRGPNIHVTAHLEADCRRLLATLQAPPSTFAVREALRLQCEQIVQKAWGADRCSVQLFGSSVNTLCDERSDVDLCLSLVPPSPAAGTGESSAPAPVLDKAAVVEELASLLSPPSHGLSDILPLPKARVPIVKFTAPASLGALKCDIGINNHLAVRNSELIRDYMRLDPRARDLCLLVKHWAKRRKINDTYRGTLSSYCYVMMVILYLQCEAHCRPPVLPCLQTWQRTERDVPVVIDGFDCWYHRDLSDLSLSGFAYSGAASNNTQSLSELLVGFFRLYAHEFDWKDLVVSVRTGMYLDKKKKIWGQSAKKDRHVFCVEDPLDPTHNLARGCDPTALYEIRGEFMRAFSLLRDGASINDLCAQYTKEWRGA